MDPYQAASDPWLGLHCSKSYDLSQQRLLERLGASFDKFMNKAVKTQKIVLNARAGLRES